MHDNRPNVRLFLLPLLVLAPACSAASASQPSPAAPTIDVSTVAVASRTIAQTQALTGSLTPNRKSDVAADATGKVAAIMVERGALLPAGAPILRLDRRSAALAEEEAAAQAGAARAQQALAERECARADKLFAEGAINGVEHDRALTQCAASRLQATAATARARLAGKNLGDAIVRAPFRGLVAERYVSEGEYVRPDTRVVTLVEVDPLRLELSVPEATVHVLQRAAEVAFQVAAFPGETFHGKIRYVGPAVRRQSRDLLVEAVVANPDRKLLPGMFATAQLATGTGEQPVVPATAVKHDNEVDRVYVVTGDRVEERLVALGMAQTDGIAVLSGLRAGERVVVPVIPELRDGARVRVR